MNWEVFWSALIGSVAVGSALNVPAWRVCAFACGVAFLLRAIGATA